ncbi:MAG: hypothetical protein HYY29_05690, partial [Chloroflexi bacterium]|nr:hypothetical protein [Chloroflexota bacterium]
GYIGKNFEADGVAGGRGGQRSLVKIKRNSNVNGLLKETLPDYDDVNGTETVFPPQNPPFMLSRDDVLYMRCQGGGGLGSPAERDPGKVQLDLEEGYISDQQARAEYANL